MVVVAPHEGRGSMLEDPLHHGRAEAELAPDLKEAVTAGFLLLKYLLAIYLLSARL
jgi:hypothetical protein